MCGVRGEAERADFAQCQEKVDICLAIVYRGEMGQCTEGILMLLLEVCSERSSRHIL